MFSKKATKIDEIFTVDLTLTTYCQNGGDDFVNFCGLLRKHELKHMILFQKYQKGKLSQLAGASNCEMLLNKKCF